MSTTHPYSTTITPDPEHGDYPISLDGAVIGYARSVHEAQALLDQFAHDCFTPPLPPRDAVAEALHVLAAHDDEPAIYLDAATQLAAGVTIAACGEGRLVGGVLVRRAPPMQRWPWPWRCDCGAARCWHGALLEGVLLAWERLGEETRIFTTKAPRHQGVEGRSAHSCIGDLELYHQGAKGEGNQSLNHQGTKTPRV